MMQKTQLEEMAAKYHLWKLLLKAKRSSSSIEIEKLFLEALKEKIKLGTNYLSFNDDLREYELGNCYTYALGLPSMKSFIRLFVGIDYENVFPFNVGFMNHSPYFLYGRDENTLLHYFLEDCHALNIKAYETDEHGPNVYGGYKIALYVSYCHGDIQDFHFIRQNKDGVWSHKKGYFNKPQLAFLAPILENRYEHFKTFEIVKPIIRERKK